MTQANEVSEQSQSVIAGYMMHPVVIIQRLRNGDAPLSLGHCFKDSLGFNGK
jgi:hypothetical protein